jgi:putative transposase
MLEELEIFIQSNPDPRELKRAIAVRMSFKGHKHRQIQEILSVSSGFISKWTQSFALQGVSALKLAHKGSVGYLTHEQRSAIIDWLKKKNYWNSEELKSHIEDEYGVVFKSQQSYYDILTEAGLSWKKTQKRNPKTDPELVKKNKRID